MSIQQILSKIKHRTWPLPSEKWKYYQEWNRAIFLHWKVDYDQLRKIVPYALEIDLFQSTPWISLVAFTMENIRPRNLPAFSPISNFNEINIRTYVKEKNKTGVYFLSIEAGNIISSKLAKVISELPYRFSEMDRNKNSFNSYNSEFGDEFNIEYEIQGDAIDGNENDKWLTERYALFQDSKKRINMFEIHHVEWPIRRMNIQKLDINYSRFQQFLSKKPDLSHYSDGVEVIAWGKK